MRQPGEPLGTALAPLILWFAPVPVAGLLVTADGGCRNAQIVIASAALVFGVWASWSHGHRQITAAGVYGLVSAVFVGYSGLWWADYSGSELDPGIFKATMVLYTTHVIAHYGFWRNRGGANVYPATLRGSATVSAWAVTVGGAVLAAAVALSRIAPALESGYTAAAAVGVMLLAVGLGSRPHGVHLGVGRTLLAGLAMGVYVLTIFTGFGRLTVATLGIACAIALSSRMKGRRLKALVVLGAPVGVFLLNQIRETAAQLGPGPDSLQSPLETFSRLTQVDPNFLYANGSTFWSAVTVFVPRAWWEGKPIGFGAELTRLLEPELVAVGHSMAATIGGEWYYNFGWTGLLALPLAVGLFVAWIDRGLARSLRSPLASRRAAIVMTAWIAVAAGLGNFVWASSFTYVNRTGFILIVLALLALGASKRVGDGTGSGGLDDVQGDDAGVGGGRRFDRERRAGNSRRHGQDLRVGEGAQRLRAQPDPRRRGY